MSLQSRIESLKDRHASLDEQIADQNHRPRPDDAALARIKLEKLRLRGQLVN